MNNEKMYINHDIEVYKNKAFLMYKALDRDYIGYIDLIKEKPKLAKFVGLFCSKSSNFDSSKILVGFNCLNFDIPIMLLFLNNTSLNQVIDIIKENIDGKEDETIFDIITKKKGLSVTKEIKQYIYNSNIIDLYKLHKWDDDSRRASLKWVACNMKADNIQDNPYGIEHEINDTELENAKSYCKNDVLLTERILKNSFEDIEMRNSIHALFYDKYKHYAKRTSKDVNPLLSKSKTSVASQIIIEHIKNKIGNIEPKQTRYIYDTWEEIITEPIKNYLLKEESLYKRIEPFVKSQLHRNKELEHTFIFENYTGSLLEMKLAKGGCHGFTHACVVDSNNDYSIIDFDVASFYPRIVMEYGFEPISLEGHFREAYKYIYEERFKHPKGTTLNKAYKEALNSVIGLSNKPGTVFFDPMFFFRITINGQLLTTILVHELIKKANCDCLMANTDGATMYVPNKNIDLFYEICKEWESQFNMLLEYTKYDKIVMQNVNSYIAMSSKDTDVLESKEISDIEWIANGKHYKLKCKGLMAFSDKDIEYHKNNGVRIVPKAIAYYFMKGRSVADTVLNEPDKHLFLEYIRRNKNTKIIIYDYKTDSYIETPFKVIRFFYCKPHTEGSVNIMRDTKNGKTAIDKEYNFMYISNQYDKETIEKHIDYGVYIKKINASILEIAKPYNINLFSKLL